MAITNGYATLDEFNLTKSTNSVNASDDAWIEGRITSASRLIDAICDTWFYAYTSTRYFDVPGGRSILLDAPLLSITTLTNGDTTVITSTHYILYPRNRKPYHEIRLTQATTYRWEEDSNNNTEGVISVLGSWGYVDRTATDPESARIIQNTNFACLEIVKMWYHQRFGENVGGTALVTAAGVVITPSGAIPKSAYDAIKGYIQVV